MRYLLFLPLLCAFACTKTESPPTVDDIADSELRKMVVELNQVLATFAPATLGGSAAARFYGGDGSGACVGGTGIWDCQSFLIGFYLESAAARFQELTTQVTVISAALDDLALTSTPVEDTAEGIPFSYLKSTTELQVLAREGTTEPNFYILRDTALTRTVIRELYPDGGGMELEVAFESEASWTLSMLTYGEPCVDPDYRAPERMALDLQYRDGAWIGKAMTYSERYDLNNEGSCQAPVTDDSAINAYTDFVSSETARKGALYLLRRDVALPTTDADMQDQFGLPAACGTFTECDVLANPFCVVDETSVPSWGSDCSGVDDNIASVPFAPLSDWPDPSVFYTEVADVPASL